MLAYITRPLDCCSCSNVSCVAGNTDKSANTIHLHSHWVLFRTMWDTMCRHVATGKMRTSPTCVLDSGQIYLNKFLLISFATNVPQNVKSGVGLETKKFYSFRSQHCCTSTPFSEWWCCPWLRLLYRLGSGLGLVLVLVCTTVLRVRICDSRPLR